MSVTYGNPNFRRKFDAFRVIDISGQEPLQNAIACALRLRLVADQVHEAMEGDLKPETRAQLTLALTRAIPDEFHAWIKVAEFVYAKPKFVEPATSPEESKRKAEEIKAGLDKLERDAISGANRTSHP